MKQEILTEIVGRTACKVLQHKMRNLDSAKEDHFYDLVVDYFNLLFGKSARSEEYLNTVFKKEIILRFPFVGPFPSAIREMINGTRLLELIAQKVGLTWEESVKNRSVDFDVPFEKSELKEIGACVKYTRVIPFVETLRLMGRYDEVESFYHQQLHIKETKMGKDDPCLLTTLQNLADLYSSGGKYKEAKRHYARMQAIVEKDPENSDTASVLQQLGSFYVKFGKYQKAEPLLQRSLKIYERKGTSLDLAEALENLANLKKLQGKVE